MTEGSAAAFAGLPAYAAVAVAVTLLLAALQALAGVWLARALRPRAAAEPGRGGRKAQRERRTEA